MTNAGETETLRWRLLFKPRTTQGQILYTNFLGPTPFSPFLSFCRPGEGLDELQPVNLILIDVLAPVTPAQDVINRAGKFNPQATGHAKRLPKSPLPINR